MIRRPADHSDRLRRGELADEEAPSASRPRSPRRRCAAATSSAARPPSPAARPWPRAPAGQPHLDGRAAAAKRKPLPPEGHADRHDRRPDDGEPLLRPLLRLAPRRRRATPGSPIPTPRATRSRPTGCHRTTRAAAPRSRPRLDRRALAVERRHATTASSPETRTSSRATSSRSATTSATTSPSCPPRQRRTRSTTAGSARSCRRRSQPALPVGRPERQAEVERVPAAARARGRLHLGDDLRPRPVEGIRSTYYVADLPPSALYGPRGVALIRPVAQFYADAAAGNLPPIGFVDPPYGDRRRGQRPSRPTSTPTPTSGSARRSCPTSRTPSSNRRSTVAVQCSSTTTSGAASSTT